MKPALKISDFTIMNAGHKKPTNSYNISRIKGKNTKSEMFALKPSRECDGKGYCFNQSNAYSGLYP